MQNIKKNHKLSKLINQIQNFENFVRYNAKESPF